MNSFVSRCLSRCLAALLALPLLLAPAPAQAWGEYAHKLAARITLAQLSPAARAEVQQILRRSAAVGTPECPMRTLEQASVWPDCVRGLGARFAFSAPWHYQNINICRPFDSNTKCENGDCVSAQIPVQLDILADRRRSPAARAQALAFFVHFVEDMHMPLHIGEKDDLGGNRVLADYGAKSPARMNLHRIWDSELAERALTEPPAIRAGRRQPVAASSQPLAEQVAIWAAESFAASRDYAYPKLGEGAAACPTTDANRRWIVDDAYVQGATPIIRRQVEAAGARTASLLNAALAR